MAERDAEVFTFLLTDIVGSVTLWADDEVAMNRALAEHDVMLHDLIEAHGGILGNRTGDGRWARFARPHAAVEAALKIQEAFRHKEWEVVGALHVRVALHTGPAIARDDDYFGNTLNQTSRLADAAEGGEILASAVVVDAVRHHLPPGVTVMSLGDLRLRGLRERLRAYQIVPPPDVPATAVGSADLAPGTPPATALQILTLGTFRVVGNGRPVPDGRWGRRKARQLFKCVITRPGRRLTRDDAYELFWPESDAAPNNLRVAIHAVRQAVESTGLAGLDNLLVLDHDGLAMRPEGAVWVDADAFEQLLAQARRASEPAPFLEAAADLYRGDYLPDDLFEDWSVARRESLRRQWTDLQLELGRVRELRDDVEGAVSALQRLLDADSCHEQAANDLMLVLARHGRRPDALRVFQRLADALRRELGVEPSDDVRETRRKIVDGEVAAEVRRRRELVRPTVPAEHLAGADLGLGSPIQLSETSPEPRDAPRPAIAFQPGYPFPSPELLVGRQREQLWLRQALDRGRTEGRTFVIGAPAGAGKSTIAGLLVREARARGFLCLAGGTFYQESPIPYGPIRDALADYLLSLPRERLRADMGELVADLEPIVPELRYHLGLPDTHASEPVDASRLLGVLHGALRSLAAQQPVVLCLEDLHAVDAATLDALHYLTRQTRRLPLTLLCTYRSEEVSPDQPIARLVATMTRERLAESLTLRSLDRDETMLLVSAVLDGQPSEALTGALFSVTEGNPLFVEQLVLALKEEGQLDERDGVWHQANTGEVTPVPSIVQAVIEGRFERLRPDSRETLEWAAVLGQTFQLGSLVAILESDDVSVTRYLESALQAQLVRETATGYRFDHAMVRETVYRRLSGSRRAMLHARAGTALETLAGPNADAQAVELARHFLLAGDRPAYRDKAIAYSLAAGRHAARLTSFVEALDHYARACDLVTQAGASPVAESRRIEALEGRAQAERELGMWTSCIVTCRGLIALSDDPTRRALARAGISRALYSLGDTAEALAEVEAGLAELAATDASAESIPVRVRLMYDRGYLLFLRGQYREAYALGEQTLSVAAPLSELEQVRLPLNVMLLAAMGLNQIDLAVQHADRGIAASERASVQLPQAVFHENAGMALYRGGRFTEAEARLRRALELYGVTASAVRTVNARQMLARVLLAQGHVKAALSLVEQGLAHAIDGNDRWAAECYELMGRIQTLLGNWPSAVTSFQRALALEERTGDPTDTADCLVGLGFVAELRGEWPEALELYRRAVASAAVADACPEQIGPRYRLGQLLARRGDLLESERHLVEARQLAESMLPTIEYGPALLALVEHGRIARGCLDLAIVDRALAAASPAACWMEAHSVAAAGFLEAGDLPRARGHTLEAMALATRLESPRLLGLAELGAARLALANGDHEAASVAFEAAIRQFESAAVPYELAVAMRDYGRMLQRAQRDTVRGSALLEAARHRFRQVGALPDADL